MRKTALAIALLLGIFAAGCGDDGEKTAQRPVTSATTSASATTTSRPTASDPADVAAVRKAVAAWGRADTPQELCALMTARLASDLLGPEINECQNRKKLEKALGIELKASRLAATEVTVGNGAAEAHTKGGVADDIYHLVKENGVWKVDSIERPQRG
jgi:hypothetical protein